MTPSKHDRRSTPAESVEAAFSLVARKRLTLGVAPQADAARPPAGSVKLFRAAAATVAGSVGAVEAFKRAGLGRAILQETAVPVDADKTTRTGLTRQVSTGHAVTWKRRALLGAASSGNLGHAPETTKTRHLVNSAAADNAGAVAVRKTRSSDRGETSEAGLDVRPIKAMILGVAHEASVAHEVRIPVLNRMLRIASEADRAHALGVYKPRPADKLTPGWTEPGLTPGTSGSGLKASVSGPTLITKTTSGGS